MLAKFEWSDSFSNFILVLLLFRMDNDDDDDDDDLTS